MVVHRLLIICFFFSSLFTPLVSAEGSLSFDSSGDINFSELLEVTTSTDSVDAMGWNNSINLIGYYPTITIDLTDSIPSGWSSTLSTIASLGRSAKIMYYGHENIFYFSQLNYLNPVVISNEHDTDEPEISQITLMSNLALGISIDSMSYEKKSVLSCDNDYQGELSFCKLLIIHENDNETTKFIFRETNVSGEYIQNFSLIKTEKEKTNFSCDDKSLFSSDDLESFSSDSTLNEISFEAFTTEQLNCLLLTTMQQSTTTPNNEQDSFFPYQREYPLVRVRLIASEWKGVWTSDSNLPCILAYSHETSDTNEFRTSNCQSSNLERSIKAIRDSAAWFISHDIFIEYNIQVLSTVSVTEDPERLCDGSSDSLSKWWKTFVGNNYDESYKSSHDFYDIVGLLIGFDEFKVNNDGEDDETYKAGCAIEGSVEKNIGSFWVEWANTMPDEVDDVQNKELTLNHEILHTLSEYEYWWFIFKKEPLHDDSKKDCTSTIKDSTVGNPDHNPSCWNNEDNRNFREIVSATKTKVQNHAIDWLPYKRIIRFGPGDSTNFEYDDTSNTLISDSLSIAELWVDISHEPIIMWIDEFRYIEVGDYSFAKRPFYNFHYKLVENDNYETVVFSIPFSGQESYSITIGSRCTSTINEFFAGIRGGITNSPNQPFDNWLGYASNYIRDEKDSTLYYSNSEWISLPVNCNNPAYEQRTPYVFEYNSGYITSACGLIPEEPFAYKVCKDGSPTLSRIKNDGSGDPISWVNHDVSETSALQYIMIWPAYEVQNPDGSVRWGIYNWNSITYTQWDYTELFVFYYTNSLGTEQNLPLSEQFVVGGEN